MGRNNLARLAPEGLRGAGQAMMLECIADAKPIMAATSDEEQVFVRSAGYCLLKTQNLSRSRIE